MKKFKVLFLIILYGLLISSCDLHFSKDEDISKHDIVSSFNGDILNFSKQNEIKQRYIDFYDLNTSYEDIVIEQYFGEYNDSYVLHIKEPYYQNYVWTEQYKNNYLYYLDSSRIIVYYKNVFFTLEYACENAYVPFDLFKKISQFHNNNLEQMKYDLIKTFNHQYNSDFAANENYDIVENKHSIKRFYGMEKHAIAFDGLIYLKNKSSNGIEEYITETLIYKENNIYTLDVAFNSGIISTSFLNVINEKKQWLDIHSLSEEEKRLLIEKLRIAEPFDQEKYSFTFLGKYDDKYVCYIKKISLNDTPSYSSNFKKVIIHGLIFEEIEKQNNSYTSIQWWDGKSKLTLPLNEEYEDVFSKEEIIKIRFVKEGY